MATKAATKKVTPVKKAIPAKNVAPVKKGTPDKKEIVMKKVVPAAKISTPEKKSIPAKSAAVSAPLAKNDKPAKNDIPKIEEKKTPAIKAPKSDNPIEAKLMALFELQKIDSQIDKIRIVRGELPIEVRDLEDEVTGLQTRVSNYTSEVNEMQDVIGKRKLAIKDAQTLIKKYESQQLNVKNNREYDSLTKEIEFQHLEIQLCEKRIKEFSAEIISKNTIIAASQDTLDERSNDLEIKKEELDSIIAETQKEEEALLKRSKEAAKIIEDRLVTAYKRIRDNARNGLAVVTVQRDSCGGCFNKIPPQRQLDIRQHKKVIVCEHCGRILVDQALGGE